MLLMLDNKRESIMQMREDILFENREDTIILIEKWDKCATHGFLEKERNNAECCEWNN